MVWPRYALVHCQMTGVNCHSDGPCTQDFEQSPSWSEEAQLLVQVGCDVYVSFKDERDVYAVARAFTRGIQAVTRIHLTLLSPEALRAFCFAVARQTFPIQAVGKIHSFNLVLTNHIKSTPNDMAYALSALTDVNHALLLLPRFLSDPLQLSDEQTIRSLTTESITLKSIRGPAPHLFNLSINARLEEEPELYTSINRLFGKSLVRLRILRHYEPYATYKGPSPARMFLLLDLPHLEYLEVRDTATMVSPCYMIISVLRNPSR